MGKQKQEEETERKKLTLFAIFSEIFWHLYCCRINQKKKKLYFVNRQQLTESGFCTIQPLIINIKLPKILHKIYWHRFYEGLVLIVIMDDIFQSVYCMMDSDFAINLVTKSVRHRWTLSIRSDFNTWKYIHIYWQQSCRRLKKIVFGKVCLFFCDFLLAVFWQE